MKKILLLSNGHGEDLNASVIASAIREINPRVHLSAFPIVGEGKSYQNKNIEIVAPIGSMPSGGMFYLKPVNLIKDLFSGLIALTIKQLMTLNKIKKDYDLIVAVGDIVPLLFAYLTKRNFFILFVAYSSYYNGKTKLSFIQRKMLNSPFCLGILTKDNLTAKDIKKIGFEKVFCFGYPIMDTLNSQGNILPLTQDKKMIALLPGSRLPEALNNLKLQLKVCEKVISKSPQLWDFYGALVPSITAQDLADICEQMGWEFLPHQGGGNILQKKIGQNWLRVRTYTNAFADILLNCDVVLGMAGTAVEQAVGLGKPVIQIIGEGPQFTYRFADAQMRLLGLNVRTIAPNPDRKKVFEQAAQEIVTVVEDKEYLAKCVENGRERVGTAGGSRAIALHVLQEI